MSLVHLIRVAVQSLLLHKLRSVLTILGVVFGVGSVVSMLAIGEGASYDAQQRLLRMGPDRIILRSSLPPETQAGSDVQAFGLTASDELHFSQLTGIAAVAPTYEIEKDFWFDDREVEGLVVGTTPAFQTVHRLQMAKGRFLSWLDVEQSANVVVLGDRIAKELFGVSDPVGKEIKHSSGHYLVAGVLKASLQQQGQVDPSEAIFMPFPTAKARFEHVVRVEDSAGKRYERVDIHQLSLQVQDVQAMPQIAAMVRNYLDRRHQNSDYQLFVPFELLKETERTKRVFNAVLGSIAGISLLVGGIGIMNIMLASVTERTREIGIRRALGAKRRDIVIQFLVESASLSTLGGIAGLILGWLIPQIVTQLSDMVTIVTPSAMIMSLGISASVGVLFGVYPARKAARMEPVEALRHT
ncbi:MAG: ABC transporter permease [Pirellulaceae bacterium]